MIIFSNQFILILFGKDFFNSISVLNYLIPGVVLLTIFKVMNTDLAGRGKPWISLKAMIPALIVNVLLNLLFIPKYGADGAALSSTISYSVAAILFLHFYSKTVQIKIKEILKFKYSDFDPILGLFKKHI
jgi:O-antigen/teichoic acid export membrane protein